MTLYHAVMKDETGCEFGCTFEAKDKDAAYERMREDYPESRCVQLEDAFDRHEREKAMWKRIEMEECGIFYPENEEDCY